MIGLHDVRQRTEVLFALLHYPNELVLCLTALRPLRDLRLTLLTLGLGPRLLLEALQRAEDALVVVSCLLAELLLHLGQALSGILSEICELRLQFLNTLLGLTLRLLVLEGGVFQLLLELIGETAEALTKLFAHVLINLTHLTLRI